MQGREMKAGNLLPIDKTPQSFDVVQVPDIGKKYHLSWAYRGAKFKLVEILNEKQCKVHTGQSNKILTVNIADLRHLRNTQPLTKK